MSQNSSQVKLTGWAQNFLTIFFFGNQGSDDEKVRQKITMMARGSKDSEKPKNRIGKKYFWLPKFWPKNCPGVSRLFFFFETYSGKETRNGKYMDLQNQPNMKRTRIGGGYMVVGYGSGGGIWIRIQSGGG